VVHLRRSSLRSSVLDDVETTRFFGKLVSNDKGRQGPAPAPSLFTL